jgi:ABC transport system ATP-binding/permease protein
VREVMEGSVARPEKRQPVVEVVVEPGKKRLSYKEKRELEDLESRIAVGEQRKAALAAELETEASNHLLVPQLYAELQLLEESLDRDLARWAELAEREG